MTFAYKILGQLYYGPEVDEIPGSGSGYYTYTITTGSKSVQPRWIAAAYNTFRAAYSDNGFSWTETEMPSFGPPGTAIQAWQEAAYGAGKFLVIAGGSNRSAYSTDGITWIASTMPAARPWTDLIFAENKFIAIESGGANHAYSEDGITWTTATFYGIPYQAWYSIAYGNGKFVAIAAGDKAVYSTNSGGVNWPSWASSTMPSSSSWSEVAYGDNKFVVVAGGSNRSAYSTDGINWTASTITPFSQYDSAYTLAYGSGKFVTAKYDSNQAAYSTDGINWTGSTLPWWADWLSLVYGGGKFVLNTAGNDNVAAYSTDGITWTAFTMPRAIPWMAVAIGEAEVNTLKQTEVQISIGGQGASGSYVEITEPQSVYTVPNSTQTTLTSIFITNQDIVQRTFDLAIVPNGETLSLKHHIRWDMPINSEDFNLINTKITMSEGDSVWVFPSTVNKVGFTIFGVEES